MCIFRLGDGKCCVTAQPLRSLSASSGGPALCRAVGAVWKGKGPVLARRSSRGTDRQPSLGTVAKGNTSSIGILPVIGNREGTIRGGIISACLGRTVRYPQHLPSCDSLCQSNSSFQLEPLRPQRLRSWYGCYRGNACKL